MTSLLRVVTLGSERGRYGGPYDTALRQATIAAEKGIAATFLAGTLEGDEPMVAAGENLRVALVPVSRAVPAPGFVGLYSRAMSREIANLVAAADVVHISMARELVPLATLQRAVRSHKRVIVQPHGMLTGRTSMIHRAIDLVLKPLVRASSAIVALTQVEADAIVRWIGERHPPIVLLGNPVPLEISNAPVRRAPASPAEALFVARLHSRKRVSDFIHAARVASGRGWSDKYTVIGPDQGELDLVLRAAVELESVTYEGTLPAREVSSRVESADIFVLPAAREPWGNVLANAIALGRPVVVCRSAALAGEIESYGCGLVVPDDDPVALAEAIHQLASDAEHYARCVDGAARFARDRLSRSHQEDVLVGLYTASATAVGKA